jgi:hypothetical protein
VRSECKSGEYFVYLLTRIFEFEASTIIVLGYKLTGRLAVGGVPDVFFGCFLKLGEILGRKAQSQEEFHISPSSDCDWPLTLS